MQALLNDLLDFNRVTLGLGIRVTRTPTDLASLCAEEIDQIRAAHPDHSVELEVAGNCHGVWDGGRIRQLLDNLVTNAINYGTPDTPVHVALAGGKDEVRLAVTNIGHIDQGTLAPIFEPLKRGTGHDHTNDFGLGLGLYIASEIAKAHGGTVEAMSEASSTTFTAHLPRRSATNVESPVVPAT